MPKILQVAGGLSSSTSTDQYFVFAQTGAGAPTTVEAEAQITYQVAGTASNLFINFVTNGTGGNQVARLRINGANGNQSITISSGATGYFEDTTNTDSIAIGDEVCLFLDRPASGNSQFTGFGANFESSGSNSMYTASAGANTASTTTSSLFGMTGSSGVSNTAQRSYVDTATTLSNMAVYISANTRTSQTGFRTIINGSAGNLSISISASTTGYFEDTSNTDSLVAGDLWQFQRVTNTGTGSITHTIIACEQEFSNINVAQYNSQTTASSPSTTNARANIFGYTTSFSTTNEARYYAECPADITMSNLRLIINSNSTSGTTTFTMRKNLVNTALSVSIGAGATGTFSDTTNQVSFSAGDQITIGFTNAGAGSIQPRNYQFLMEYASGFTPIVVFF